MNYSKDDYFKLYPSCIPAKGYTRSIIIDTNKRKLHYISNNHFTIIEAFKTKSITAIISSKKDSEEYTLLSFLLKNNFGQIIKKEEYDNFLPIDNKVNIPFSSNSIIDIGIVDFSSIKVTLQKLKEAKIANIQFRFLKDLVFTDLEEIVLLIEVYSFYSTEFLISSNLYDSMSDENISFIEKCQLITKVFVFNAKIEKLQRISKFLFLNNPLNEYNLCGHTSVKYFSSFLETVINSQRYNSCLNCKISIDINGEVKNCPSMKKSYGDIKDVSLVDTLNIPSFQKFNKITKDDIDVCKDCEYRYVCSDCRAYIDNPNNIYSRPEKCNYNPYICKWKDEEGYKTLKECGVISNEKGFSINHKKIEVINKILWEEEIENA